MRRTEQKQNGLSNEISSWLASRIPIKEVNEITIHQAGSFATFQVIHAEFTNNARSTYIFGTAECKILVLPPYLFTVRSQKLGWRQQRVPIREN